MWLVVRYRNEILERLKSIEVPLPTGCIRCPLCRAHVVGELTLPTTAAVCTACYGNQQLPGQSLSCVYVLTHGICKFGLGLGASLHSLPSMAPQILIVGAGVTGSMLALLVKDMGLSVRVLEKSRGAGGRMATYTYRQGDRSSPVLAQADLGAQYITTRSSPDHPILGPLYKRLCDAGVLKPFTAEIAGPNPYGAASADVRHFTAPNGLKSVSQYLLESSGVPVDWGVAVDDLTLSEAGEVSVSVKEGTLPAEAAAANVVVLTQPPPQVLGASKFGMRGSFLQYTPEATAAGLKKVEYSSRFAVAYFFDKAKVTWPFSWTCQYFDKGDVRYVAHDSAKRHSTHETMISVLVHSGVPLGIELKDEEDFGIWCWCSGCAT